MNAVLKPAAPHLRPQALGQLLIARGLITSADLDRALQAQKTLGTRIGRTLVRLGALSEDSLMPALADHLGLQLLGEDELRLRGFDIQQAVARSGIAVAWFIEQGIALYEAEPGVMHCASRDPLSSFAHESLQAALPSHRLVWHLMRSRDQEWLDKLLQSEAQSAAAASDEVTHLRELAEEAPVIDLVNGLLAQATDERASDIHLEPQEHEFVVRFRVDGVLRHRGSYAPSRFPAVASRVKLIAGLDIAERRLPQDGRISLRVSGVETDVRVSSVPGVHGESIVLRLLPKNRAEFHLDRLGMEADHLQQFKAWTDEPHGIVLVTGPTGSGKSTTLYSALASANDGLRKIITVENPVEYRMRGVTQIQTQTEIGYDFARALRAVLRQDPDIIMIGEIRDRETAEIAVQSALTGHMVFATLHTNDAIAAFTRLVDMGVEPFMVASSVRAVQAQRLVRQLCPHCAQPVQPAPLVAEALAAIRQRHPGLLEGQPRWLGPKGCTQCEGSGYRGRLGIYEMLEVDPEMQQALGQHQPSHQLQALARARGFRTLREDGLIKASRGLTSVEEVLRVTGAAATEAER